MSKTIPRMLGVGAGLLFGIAGCSSSPTHVEEYEGSLPVYGQTKIHMETRESPLPKISVRVWCDYLGGAECPREYGWDLIDEEGDGKFDFGSLPYKPSGFNVLMNRRVDSTNFPNDFLKLREVTNAALEARGTDLKKTKDFYLTRP